MARQWPKTACRVRQRSPKTCNSGEVVCGKRAISIDTALRLSKALGVDDRFWINVQIDYDLEVARDLYAEAVAKVTTLVAS